MIGNEELNPPEVAKMLIVSTGHITELDDQILRLDQASDLSVYPNLEYGPMVHIPYDDGGLMQELIDGTLTGIDNSLSPSFVKCFALAGRLGCRFLRFDCDAGFTEGLDIHDW